MQTNSWRQSQCRKLALSFPPYGSAPICSHFIAGINDGRAAAAFGARGFRLFFCRRFLFFSFYSVCFMLNQVEIQLICFGFSFEYGKAKYAKGSTIVGDSLCHAHHRHMLSFKGSEQLNQQV